MTQAPAQLSADVAKTSGFRPEIQALRALAASAVVLYHFWPHWFSGGYAGVDIFFVISGFLITSHLMKELSRTGGLKLASFYARRIRRLLPAALLVLTASVALTYWLIPRVLWSQYFKEVIGSTFYVENWVLVADAVDYLAAENAPSLAQHYWSLSVEEQFYLFWPLLILGAFWLAHRLSRSWRPVVQTVLTTVLVSSLFASIYVTYAGPAAQAYFATYTRAWQFAAGGVLALASARIRLGTTTAATLGVIGWAALVVTIFTFNASTPFPGFAAALPVAGTVLVIMTGPALGTFRITPWVNWGWVNELGASSYSLYLWHWPLITAMPYVLPQGAGSTVTTAVKLGLLATTVGLAMLSRRWVEDPVRTYPRLTRSNALTFASALVAMALVAGTTVPGFVLTAQASTQSKADADRLIASGAECFGARSPLSETQPCVNPALDGVLLPQPAARLDDTANAYFCYQTTPSAPLPNCTIGSKRPDALRVAITGDSHAASLIPALTPLLTARNWKLDIFVGRGCVWLAAEDPSCDAWRQALRDRFNNGPKYDLIIVTATHHNLRPQDSQPRAEQFAQEWATAMKRGTQIVAVADNPSVPQAAFDCIERSSDYASAAQCSFPQSAGWVAADPLPDAVKLAGKGASLFDLTSVYCQDGTCPMVIGHVITYRDTHHITATFAKTLGPELVERIATAIRR